MNRSPSRFLLINNNNSRTKFALASSQGLIEHRVMETREVDRSGVDALVAGWHFDQIVLASVVPARAEVLRRCFEVPLVEVSARINLGVQVDFPQPETVGADRLANAAAVASRVADRPCIVVDFGTAVTFDIVVPGPAYIGGVIAPGLDVMREYLHQRTALLPLIDLEEPPSAIGRSTEHAMLSGAVHGYRGLVREILQQVSAELRARLGLPALPQLVATGGHAGLISAGLPEIGSVEPFLTMDGLLQIGLLQFPS
ncbi:MAG: type III pantothenate kinase [Verrucomicrobiales bacterium]|nr:type III pantothenate kinase [Verrucomicrobiales bacterium]